MERITEYLPVHPLLVLIATLFLGGCGGSNRVVSYDASAGKTTYESDFISVIRNVSDSGIGSGASIVMRGVARCSGKHCTPEIIRIMFSVSGTSNLGIQNRSVTLTADGEQYSWEDRTGRQQIGEMKSVAGHIAGVRLRLPQLEKIAKASVVEGKIGGYAFELDEVDQEKLRRFLSVIQNPTVEEEQAT